MDKFINIIGGAGAGRSSSWGRGGGGGGSDKNMEVVGGSSSVVAIKKGGTIVRRGNLQNTHTVFSSFQSWLGEVNAGVNVGRGPRQEPPPQGPSRLPGARPLVTRK